MRRFVNRVERPSPGVCCHLLMFSLGGNFTKSVRPLTFGLIILGTHSSERHESAGFDPDRLNDHY